MLSVCQDHLSRIACQIIVDFNYFGLVFLWSLGAQKKSSCYVNALKDTIIIEFLLYFVSFCAYSKPLGFFSQTYSYEIQHKHCKLIFQVISYKMSANDRKLQFIILYNRYFPLIYNTENGAEPSVRLTLDGILKQKISCNYSTCKTKISQCYDISFFTQSILEI